MLRISSDASVLSRRAFSTFRILPAQRQHRLERAVAALLGRAAGRVALDQVQLAVLGVALLALGELAGQSRPVEGTLAAREVARLPGRLPGARGVEDLRGDALGVLRVLLEERGEPLVHQALDDALHLGVAELGLGLALELRVRDLDADDGGQPLARVLALEALALLEQPRLQAVAVEAARQRAAEAGEVAAAVVGVDVVGVAVDVLGVAVVPLQRDLDRHLLAHAAELDRLAGQRLLVAVQVLDEGADAALVLEAVLLVVALVLECDQDAAVQERELAQPLRQRVEAEGGRLEDLRVGLEGDLGAAPVGGAGLLEPGLRQAARVRLAVDLAVAPDLELDELRERVHDRDADAVESARDLVGPFVELASGVQLGHHDFGRVEAGLVRPHRDAAPVVDHRHGVVDVDRDRDLAAVAGERLVDRVVHHLVDEVVEARPRRSSRCTSRAGRGPPRAPPGCGSPPRRTRPGRLPVSCLASRSCPPSSLAPGRQAQRTAPPETS